ncbi:hypothetical protein FAGKG844_110041 [Frankia sp. AgKG'84/4]
MTTLTGTLSKSQLLGFDGGTGD